MEQNQLISELPGCEGPFLGIVDPVVPLASSAYVDDNTTIGEVEDASLATCVADKMLDIVYKH
eukprot:433242-Pyramimonas_sp.AAC.1